MTRRKKEEAKALDGAILDILSTNAEATYSEIGKKVGASSSTVFNRILKLENEGVIRGYIAVLDRVKAGKGTGAILLLSIDHQASVEEVSETLCGIPGVEAVYEIGGEADIVALIYAESIEKLRQLVNDRINSIPGAANVTPLMIMRVYKEYGITF
ncbi:MAG: Lrp/AsnC family transcriptional regulator [Thermoprotei archaeon]